MLKSKKTKKLPLLHPGEYLRSVLEDAGLSANAVALALRVPANRLTEILNGRRAITADTAMRLGRYFGTLAQMWMNLQARYDLEAAEENWPNASNWKCSRCCGRRNASNLRAEYLWQAWVPGCS